MAKTIYLVDVKPAKVRPSNIKRTYTLKCTVRTIDPDTGERIRPQTESERYNNLCPNAWAIRFN